MKHNYLVRIWLDDKTVGNINLRNSSEYQANRFFYALASISKVSSIRFGALYLVISDGRKYPYYQRINSFNRDGDIESILSAVCDHILINQGG